MRRRRHGYLLVILSLALAGCEVVDDQLNDVPPPAPEAASQPEGEATPPAEGEHAAPAAGEAAPTEGEGAPAEGEAAPADGEAPPAEGEAAPAEAESVPTSSETSETSPAGEGEAAPDDILGAVAGAAAAATAAGDKTETGASATETADLAEAVAAAGRESVKESLLAAERAEKRTAAEAELAARVARQKQYLANAQHHAEYLGLRIKEQNLELASLQSALLSASLDGVRSQSGPGPAADELAFALGALYDLQTINQDQNAAVANAMTHLDAALALLPPAGPAAATDTSLQPGEEQPAKPETAAPTNAGEDPASSPEAMAREVVAIQQLFAAGQKRTGRDRLQKLVLAGVDNPVEDLLNLADEARERVSQAVVRQAWGSAARQLERVNSLLTELSTTIGAPAATPVAAAPSSAPSSGRTAPSSTPSSSRTAPSSGGGLVRLGDETHSGSGSAAAGAKGEEHER